MSIRFSLTHAWREVRGSLHHFRFFLFCIALGVGSLVGIDNFSNHLAEATLHEARTLLAADLELRVARPSQVDDGPVLAWLAGQGIEVVPVTELLAMAAPLSGSSSQLVELKAVGGGYPFYGSVQREPPGETEIGADPSGVVAQEGLFLRLNLRVGEKIRLGEATFVLRGVLRREPDRMAGPFSLGPRVLISQQGLRQTGLVQPGSRVRYRYLLKVPPTLSLEEVQAGLRRKLPEEGVEIRSYRDVQTEMKRLIENLMAYIGLVGLITLLVGGLGVAGSIRAFLSERVGHLAILKSLGASSNELLAAYLIQTLSLASLGSILGAALGLAVQFFLQRQLRSFLPVELSLLGGWRSIANGIARAMAMGTLTATLFALRPLLTLRTVSASRLFRQDVEGRSASSWNTYLVLLGVGAGLFGIVFWQCRSIKLAFWVAGALLLSIGILFGLTFLFLVILKRIRAPRVGPLLLHGLANLYRPGNQTFPVMISLGVGLTVLITLALVEGSLMAHLREKVPTDAPSLFFIDLQPDQKDPLEKMLARVPLEAPPRLTPLVRSRLESVDDRKTSEIKADRADRWYFNREYVLTEQPGIPEHNRIVEGRWWNSGQPEPSVSVEKEAARHLGIHLGTRLTFDVQGVPLEVTVTSLREVDWGSFTTNFFMILSPGALAGAPTTYVAELRAPREEDLAIQTAAIRAFPNVTVISLRDVLEGIARLLDRIGWAIRWLASLSLLCGLVVLAGSLAATRFRRLREMAILKCLGATRSDLLRILSVEYLLMGFLAGTTAALLSIPLAYAIVRFLLNTPWFFTPGRLVWGVAVATLVTWATGLLGSLRTVSGKPLITLRMQ